MAVVQVFDNEKEATRELVRSKDDIIVYHTGNEKIEIQIKQLFRYRSQDGVRGVKKNHVPKKRRKTGIRKHNR
jgi:hypothetical protein